MTKILVSNPTPYTRRETVHFGCPLDVRTGTLLKVVPGAQVRAATVTVEPFASGYQDIIEGEVPLEGHGMPEVDLSFFEDGTEIPFSWEERLTREDNGSMDVDVYKAVGTNWVGRMIVTKTPHEPWIKYTILAHCVSLYAKEIPCDLGYRIDSGPGGVTYDRLKGSDTVNWHRVTSPEEDPDGLIRDATTLTSEGVHIQGYLVSAAEDPGLLSTAVALSTWDLTAAGDWRAAWGPWATVPRGTHFDRRNAFGLRDHLGVILNKRPGDTGEQPGFGFWKHLDVISMGNGFALDHDRWAVGKEWNRPIAWLDADGSWPHKDDHPKFASWSEKPHWHKGVSPDQFRRIGEGAFYAGWLGMDEEHIACSYLKEDFFLRGSWSSYLCLRQKGFLLKTQGRWSGTGRALGRCGMAAWDCYQATGDKELLEDMKTRLLPAIKKNFEDINGVSLDADPSTWDPKARAYVTRIIADDPHTGIEGFEWVVWEDGIAVPALDKLAELFADPQLSLITYVVGASICIHGIHNGTGGDGRILKAIKWNGSGSVGPKVASSRQTNYHAWAYGAWAVTARMAGSFGDQQLAGKAGDLGEKVRSGNYGNKDSYLAPAP